VGGALLAATIHFTPQTPPGGGTPVTLGKPMLGPFVPAVPTASVPVGLSVTVIQ
jgi:hypothetical protein